METVAQAWNAEHYARDGRFVPELGAPLVALLDPRPGERILDLGCGDGTLTTTIADCGATVVGVDGSPELAGVARRRGLDVRLGDAQALVFDGEFDAVFSNAALHWMPRAADVAGGVFRALRPGGRFVGEFGGFGNVAAIVTALVAALEAQGARDVPSPWYFPRADQYRALLEGSGFVVDAAETFARPTPLPTGLRAWLATFAHAFFASGDGIDRDRAYADVERYLAPSLRGTDGTWIADYVRLRFVARRPRVAARTVTG